jgi:hypothetical protein
MFSALWVTSATDSRDFILLGHGCKIKKEIANRHAIPGMRFTG